MDESHWSRRGARCTGWPSWSSRVPSSAPRARSSCASGPVVSVGTSPRYAWTAETWCGTAASGPGRTCRELAAASGQEVSQLADVYADGSGVDPDEPLTFDAKALDRLLGWFVRATPPCGPSPPTSTHPVAGALRRRFAVDEVNYGASPGDATHTGPYAYVGPWTPREGEFWNAPFGALRDADELRTLTRS